MTFVPNREPGRARNIPNTMIVEFQSWSGAYRACLDQVLGCVRDEGEPGGQGAIQD